MKKIDITVADNIVGTIVALVAEYATELHVTSVSEPAKPPGRVYRAVSAKVVRRVDGKSIDDHLTEWMGDRTVSRDEINEFIRSLGYGHNSGASCISKMVDAGKALRIGNKNYKLAEAA